ncbi:MAG: PEGA domain-containing protein, partial [Planctomycetota bacterium]
MARPTRLFAALVPVLALAALAEAAETGMLYVKSDPPGATVVIAGEERGRTPVLVKGLPPGRVVVELRLAG